MFIEDFFERRGVFERNRKASPFISALTREQMKRYRRKKIVPVPFWQYLIEIGAIRASDMPMRHERTTIRLKTILSEKENEKACQVLFGLNATIRYRDGLHFLRGYRLEIASINKLINRYPNPNRIEGETK